MVDDKQTSPEHITEYYARRWQKEARQPLSLHEKWRALFIIQNIKKIKQEVGTLDMLEIGCGRGWLTALLSQFGKVTGIDLSSDTAKVLYPDLQFLEGDILTYAIDKRFNVIVCSEVIEHVIEQNRFVERLSELLTDSGYLLLTTPNGNLARKLLEDGLFRNKDLQPIENWLTPDELIKVCSSKFSTLHIAGIMYMPWMFRLHKFSQLLYEIFINRTYLYYLLASCRLPIQQCLYLGLVARHRQSH